MKKINELINAIRVRLPKDKWCHISLLSPSPFIPYLYLLISVHPLSRALQIGGGFENQPPKELPLPYFIRASSTNQQKPC